MRRLLAPAIAGAFLGLSSVAHAESGDSVFVLPGYIHSFVGGHSPAAGNGVEISLVDVGVRTNAFGAFTQLESLSGDAGNSKRWALGGELSALGFGLELAYVMRTHDDAHSTTYGVHFAPFWSIGFFSVAYRWTFAVSGSHESDHGFVLALKIPIPIVGGIDKLDPLFGGSATVFGAGRPLRDRGGVVVPTARVAARGRRRRAPSIAPNARHAARWLADAAMEHASVAAFARLEAELVALGAPPSLVAGARRARREEVRHARVSYEIAGAYADRVIEPGALREADARPADLLRVACESFVDGCLGEGRAAIAARRRGRRAREPFVANALAAIAREEASHAAHAWDVVAWCVDRGGVAVAESLMCLAASLLGARPTFEVRRATRRLERVLIGAERAASKKRAVVHPQRARTFFVHASLPLRNDSSYRPSP